MAKLLEVESLGQEAWALGDSNPSGSSVEPLEPPVCSSFLTSPFFPLIRLTAQSLIKTWP